MSQTQGHKISIDAFITYDDLSFPQSVTVSNYGGMPVSAVRAVAQEALDSRFGMTSLRHGYAIDTHPSEVINEGGVESMVLEVLNLNEKG